MGLCAEKPEHPQCEEYRRTVDLRQKAKIALAIASDYESERRLASAIEWYGHWQRCTAVYVYTRFDADCKRDPAASDEEHDCARRDALVNIVQQARNNWEYLLRVHAKAQAARSSHRFTFPPRPPNLTAPQWDLWLKLVGGDEDMEEAMARMGLLAMRSKKSVEADKAKALRAAMAAVEAKQAAALEAQTRASAMAASPVQVTVNPTINPTIHFNPSTNISGSTAHGGASTNTVTGATASPSVAQTGSGDVAAATGAAAAGGAVSAPGGATSGAVGSGAASHEPAAVALSSQAPSYGFPAPTFGQAPGLPAMPVSYTAAPAAGPLPVVAPQLGPLQPVMTATGQIVYVPVQQPVPPQPLGSIASAPYPSAPPAPPPVAFATPAMADGCSA